MGGAHAAAWAAIDGVEIAGIVGRGPERVGELARSFGVPGHTDPLKLLDDDRIDAIDVTLPTTLHRSFVEAALERGKHVLCETPFARDLDAARAMAEAARKHAGVLQVALLSRVAQPGAAIRDRIRSGALGRPLAVSTQRLWPGGTRTSQAGGVDHHGDAIEELLLFDLDYLVWALGPPDRILASAVEAPHGGVDQVCALLEHGEVRAFAEASRIAPRSRPFTISARVVCEAGAIETEIRFSTGQGDGGIPAVSCIEYRDDGDPATVDFRGADPYEAECRHFAACIRGEADPALLSPEAALASLEVADDVRRAAETGTPVSR